MPIDLLSVDHLPNIELPTVLKNWIDLLVFEISSQRLNLAKDSKLLLQILQQAQQLNILNVKLPAQFGGIDLTIAQRHYYFREMARASGSLAFLATQHSGALAVLGRSLNEALKQEYLQQHYLFGIAFSHLRETNKPPVTATYDNNHYIINGKLRYVTGYTLFNMLLFAFICDEKEFFAVMPLQESSSFKIIAELNLITANSTKTVSCQFNDHVINKAMIVSKNPVGHFIMQSNKNNNAAPIAAFHLGIALAVLDLMAKHKYLEIDLVRLTYNKLITEIVECEKQLIADTEYGQILAIRIKIIDLLYKVFMFGDQIFKGASTLVDNPYYLLKQEAQILLSSGSSTETLLETCKFICM